MGRELAEASAEAMDFWKLGEKVSGLPLREIFWEGSPADISDTRALQPALTIVHINAWRQLAPRVSPFAAAGHSLGEFSALAAAGAISPEAALEITSARGRLMADADPEGRGAMAALLKLDGDAAERVVLEVREGGAGTIVMANYNTPAQHVVSGDKEAVEQACRLAKSLGGRGMQLKVSGAFHSPLMASANEMLQPVLEKAQWRDPAFPVYCNVDGKPATTAAEARKGILRQMISPVWWMNIIRNLYLAGVRWWMEISPRSVLGKMLGPSVAALGADADSMRIELINSLSHIMNSAG